MIAASLLLLAGQSSAAIECDSPENFLPYGLCRAEQRKEAAESKLDRVLKEAQRAAGRERDDYIEWTKSGRNSTLDADEIASLENAQDLWRTSMEADCLLVAAAFKRAFTSAVPHEEVANCEADRITQRIVFLQQRYNLEEKFDD